MPKKLDLTGQRFGRLIALESGPKHGKRTTWKCICDCGNECTILTENLRGGITQSCGCIRSERLVKRNKASAEDLRGKRFGKLIVIQQVQSKRGRTCWLCQCDCGNTKEVCSMELKNGDTLSCGCLRSSYGEIVIEQILKDNNILYKKEYEFHDLLSEHQVPLRFDFVLFDSSGIIFRIIEYDGEQHFLDKTNKFWKNDSLEKRQQRDKQKNEYCLQHDYPIVRIPYWEKNNISLDLILGNKYLIQ